MLSLYLHIPFCRRKCPYCDFCSIDDTGPLALFCDALTREIALTSADLRGESVATIYFGGGTPSLLSPRQLEAILAQLDRSFRVAADAEITLEANPGTVTREALAAFRSLGVNRLSVGVQSFDDRELAFLGRIHTGAEAAGCLADARAAGFDNLAIDLIYSLPGQTLSQWEASLRAGVRCAPRHIAAYSLVVEPGTPLGRAVRAGSVRPNPAEHDARLYECAMDLLPARGFAQYEVSNFAEPGRRCRHNQTYWSHGDYVGFGPSAHSFRMHGGGRSGARRWNVPDLPTYLARLGEGRAPVSGAEEIGPSDLIREKLLLGLRSDGLNLTLLGTHFGCDLASRQGALIRRLTEEGLTRWEDPMLRLTPKGYVICDEICARLARDVDPGFDPPPLGPEPSRPAPRRVYLPDVA